MEKELPNRWVETKLELATDILDNLRKPINSTERGARTGNIPYYGATGQAGWIDDYIFNEELVLLGEDGAPFLDKSKNVAYQIKGKSWVNNHAHVLKAKDNVSTNRFLLYFLNQFDYKDFVGGTTRLKLTQSDLRNIPVPLPPLPEQQRIVAKLDTLFGQLDRIKTSMERIPQLLKDFRQKVLTQAVTGKLTEEWREERGIVERWETTALDSICEKTRGISYGVIKLGESDKNGVPCMRTSDVKPLHIDTSSVKRISKSISDNYKRTILKGNEVLVNIRGTLGGIAAVSDDFVGWNVSREIATVPILDSINQKYIAVFIASTESQDWLNVVAKGIAYTGINLADLRNLPVRLPKSEEQNEIVRRVESLFAKADQIEASCQKLKAKIEQLPQALLAKAFRGELVEQLPTDGDASDLLEQIKKAKAGLEKGGKSKKLGKEVPVRMAAEGKVRYGKK